MGNIYYIELILSNIKVLPKELPVILIALWLFLALVKSPWSADNDFTTLSRVCDVLQIVLG